MKRRNLLKLAAAVAVAGSLAAPAIAQETLTVGAVGPKTGPLAGGAVVTHFPNVQLWVHDVNARGGLDVGGTKYMLELIEYDDQTNPAETIKAIQRLVTQDGADIVLPPYSTGLNLAVAPLFQQFNLPMIASTANTDDSEALSAQFPNMFFTLGGSAAIAQSLADMLSELRDSGEIGNRVAMVNVADAFGIELANAARPAIEGAGFELVYDSSYPLGTQDLSPVIKAAADADPDAFVAWSYPPDTFGLTEQAMIEGLDTKVFFTAVGSAFPAYRDVFGPAANAIFGIGGVNQADPDFQEYAARHMEVTGSEPDYWASAVVYSTYQVLEQAIEGAGTLDGTAVVDYIKNNSFDTVIGTLEYDEHNYNNSFWTIGQWQDGVFEGIASTGREGAVDPIMKEGWE